MDLNSAPRRLQGILYKTAQPHLRTPQGGRTREVTSISQELESGLDLGKRLKVGLLLGGGKGPVKRKDAERSQRSASWRLGLGERLEAEVDSI